MLGWTRIPKAQLSLVRGSMRSPCVFLSFHPGESRNLIQMQRNRGKGEMGNEEKGVVVWETPAPHSMPWCGVQAKPSWSLCVWEVGFSFPKE